MVSLRPRANSSSCCPGETFGHLYRSAVAATAPGAAVGHQQSVYRGHSSGHYAHCAGDQIDLRSHQSVTLRASPAPVILALSGTQLVSVSAQSSNVDLLPNSAIVITPACGSATSTCTATFKPTAGATGSTTLSFRITNAYQQSAKASATLQVNPAAPPPAAPPPPAPKASSGGGGLWISSRCSG